jgi:hypothetical protein
MLTYRGIISPPKSWPRWSRRWPTTRSAGSTVHAEDPRTATGGPGSGPPIGRQHIGFDLRMNCTTVTGSASRNRSLEPCSDPATLLPATSSDGSEVSDGDRRENTTGQDMDQGTRNEVLGGPAEVVRAVPAAHPTRVAVDGPRAAGKTTLADELAAVPPLAALNWSSLVFLPDPGRWASGPVRDFVGRVEAFDGAASEPGAR